MTAKSTLTIRDVAPEIKYALRQKAARNNRSMEAEVRAMLQQYCLQDSVGEEHLVYRTRRLVEAVGGIELPADTLRDRGSDEHRIPDFDSDKQ